MCGICGAVSLEGPLRLPDGVPERMIGVLRHRGPDEFGAWRDEAAFLGHARLSIIDLAGGRQPLANEDGSIWVAFNGEIFNYPELTAELAGRGHRFRTRSDTETIVHAWEEWGERCVERFNGQFAFAIWDRPRRTLFLARDRFGIRPLFTAVRDGRLLFASELKAILAWPGFPARIAPAAVAEVLTYWVNVAPATPFAGISQLPPGCTAVVDLGRVASGTVGAADASARGDAPATELPAALRVRRYWRPSFLPAAEDHRYVPPSEERDWARRLREKLVEAATIRLRADVPVGAYLSGGLDSSATAAVVRRRTDRLKTFSVGFADPAYDESAWQRTMADFLGTDHRQVDVDADDIAGALADVVWHAETPILRTAPSPLFHLSRLVRGEDYKVVLTGEGADEVLVGYNIFREAKVRAFWSRDPSSQRRPLLLTRLYPYLAQSPPRILQRFYGQGLDRPDDPFFSHRPRWDNTGRATGFLREEARRALAAEAPEERLAAELPAEFASWGPVARAQYVEMSTFLPGYLLSSQGDRMLMGNSVEGRFPFLDHTLAELAASIPAAIKLQSLREKSILKMAVADLLPEGIVSRPKQPYRAPDGASFVGAAARATVAELTGPEGLLATGLFEPGRVAALVRKWEAGRLTSVRENMAFVGILSTQILAGLFTRGFADRVAETALRPGELAWRDAPDAG